MNQNLSNQPKIVILGGGYAGISAAQRFSRENLNFDVTIIDRSTHQLQLTRLHETANRPIASIKISFEELAKQFHFTFCLDEVNYSLADLEVWQKNRAIQTQTTSVAFDYLILSTGSTPITLNENYCVSEATIRKTGLQPYVRQIKNLQKDKKVTINVVGLGATSLQFIFELIAAVDTKQIRFNIIGLEKCFFSEYPEVFDKYIKKKCEMSNINVLFRHKYISASKKKITLFDMVKREEISIATDLTFLFPGVQSNPEVLSCNSFGQVEHRGVAHENIFSCGDCSSYASGLNRLSAQAAMRKGRITGDNIIALVRNKKMSSYHFKEVGVFISLGPFDGVGWLLFKNNMLTGLPAFALKEIIEAQYQFFIKGIDTYLI